MSLSEVTQVLKYLRKKGDSSWIGKTYRSSLFQENAPKDIPIVINYTDHISLGIAIGTIGSMYKVEQKDEFYTFTAHGRTFSLRYHPLVKVVDFDLIHYDYSCATFYRGETILLQEQGEEFGKKRCRLLPVTDGTKWKESQRALLRYIKSGWTILDEEDKKVVFLSQREEGSRIFDSGDQQQLNPEVLWKKITVAEVKPEPTPEPMTDADKAELKALLVKYNEFKIELKALLAKYDMI